jgi:hypothetical protein
VGRYLNVPEREPGYRAGRPHEAFVTNLPAPAGDMKEQITAVFGAGPGDADERVLRRVPGLIAEKYGRAEWVRRR